MVRIDSPALIRVSHRRPSSDRGTSAHAGNARYAEELAEVESSVSRAALLLRQTLKKAG